MKASFVKSFVLLAVVVLVFMLAAVALLVGARAVGGAESIEHRLLLAALAIGGALYGVAKSSTRDDDAREGYSLSVTQDVVRHRRGAFMKTHG